MGEYQAKKDSARGIKEGPRSTPSRPQLIYILSLCRRRELGKKKGAGSEGYGKKKMAMSARN